MQVPQIVTGDYDSILKEALARIPVHNPEWTNFNNSDPGITLLQLFAYIADNLNYRINQIPLRNYRKFLNLLSIPLKAAESYKGIVTFQGSPGYVEAVTLKSGLELYAGQVPFFTLDGPAILPLEANIYYKSVLPESKYLEAWAMYSAIYPDKFLQAESEPFFYETKQFTAPLPGTYVPSLDITTNTVDKTLWIALLAQGSDVVEETRAAIAGSVLSLAILPELKDAKRVLSPQNGMQGNELSAFEFSLPIGETLPPDQGERIARYRVLDARTNGDFLTGPYLVQLPLPDYNGLKLWDNLRPFEPGFTDFPPYIEELDIAGRIVTWIRIRPVSNSANSIYWAGINAARVEQGTRITGENLGQGTGEPDQSVTLANKPVIAQSLELTVNGIPWTEIGDLMEADPEVAVYSPFLQAAPVTKPHNMVFMLDRESGRIRFGDGLHGTRPARSAVIRANYSYGGGKQGNVGIGAINRGSDLPLGVKVSNPVTTWGGSDGESIADAVKRIPGFIRHQERLVSQEDFVTLTRETPGTELGRVEALPLFHPDYPSQSMGGAVTLLVIPACDAIQPDAPLPDRLCIEKICDYIHPRRLVTTEVHITGPDYINIYLAVGIDVIPGKSLAPVIENVKLELRSFLSPLDGGFEKKGWELNRAVDPVELMVVAARVAGVLKVNKVILLDSDKKLVPGSISITGIQLPRLITVTVEQGSVSGITEETVPAGTGRGNIVPIPVVSPVCKC